MMGHFEAGEEVDKIFGAQKNLKAKIYDGTHSHQMLQAPYICCTSFLELPHVAKLESTLYRVANSKQWLKKVFPNSCGSNKD